MSGDRFYEKGFAGERRSAPAALRNREPIADVLEEWLPSSGLVLEIASGTGEHVVHFAERFPSLDWQPSDVDPVSLSSIKAWRDAVRYRNIRAPIALDAASSDWPVGGADAILSINMVHISPWSSAVGLVRGAERLLAKGHPLVLYGPWLKGDVPTAPSNCDFDVELRERNSRWGLRRVEDFAEAAASYGLALTDVRSMPANNMMLLLRRR